MYGWLPDLPDGRDWLTPRLTIVKPDAILPPKVDLRTSGHLSPVYDQGALGSCTANALAAAVDFERHRQGLDWLTPSRLFIYYNERVIEGTVGQDAGAQLRDGMKALNKWGAPPETDWPYDPPRFAVLPAAMVYADGRLDAALAYARAPQELDQLRALLAQGYPVVVGFTVYASFEDATVAATGTAPMPRPDEAVMGGHAVLLVGYDSGTRRWLLRNSWGTGWGDGGYFTLPFEYLTDPNLARDFWSLTLVGPEPAPTPAPTPAPPKRCGLFHRIFG